MMMMMGYGQIACSVILIDLITQILFHGLLYCTDQHRHDSARTMGSNTIQLQRRCTPLPSIQSWRCQPTRLATTRRYTSASIGPPSQLTSCWAAATAARRPPPERKYFRPQARRRNKPGIWFVANQIHQTHSPP